MIAKPAQVVKGTVAAVTAPFAAFLDCGEFQVASSSPEQFLRLSGSHIQTRPITGTRPRDSDPTRDAQLAYELQTSPKELAELVMITDLLRNDLGRVCEFGSVQVPELVRLERYAQVQHLVSTVEGRLLAFEPKVRPRLWLARYRSWPQSQIARPIPHPSRFHWR